MKKFYLIILFAFLASFGSYITAAETWTKVTSTPDDWSGDYLIVYETGKVAFDGSLTKLDVASNTKSVTISDGTITTEGCKFYFTIEPAAKTGGYTIKSASGKYIGRTSTGNGLSISTSPTYTNTLLLNTGGDISIKSSAGTYLRYNANNSDKRFRYYEKGQKAIHLYKKVQAAPTAVATPKFDFADGTYYKKIKASATTTTKGATVHYSYTKVGEPQTIDNGTNAPVLSTVGTYVVTAIAKDATDRLKPSDPVTATYTITAPEAPVFSIEEGTYYDPQTLTMTCATSEAKIYYTVYSGCCELENVEYTEAITLDNNDDYIISAFASVDGVIKSEETSIYVTINKTCQAPKYSFADGEIVNGKTYDNTQAITISTATVGAKVTYTLTKDGTVVGNENEVYSAPIAINSNGNYTIKANVTKDGYTSFTATEAVAFSISINVAEPTISGVAAGETYTEAKTVTINCSTADAVVVYSINGESKTSEGQTATITLDKNGTYNISAYGIREGFSNSTTVTIEGVVINITCAKPTVSVAQGTYNKTQSVAISTTDDATIHYTLNDGEDTVYNGEIEMTVGTGASTYTLTVWAVKDGWNNSDPVTYTYIIDPNANKGIFARINKVEHFAADDKVIIVSEQARMIMSTYESSAFNGKSASVEGSYTIPIGDNEISILTIENGATAGTYKLKCADEYLNLSTSGANITTTTKGSENKISFKENNVYIRNNDTRSIVWRAGSTNLFKHYSDNNINNTEYYNVQLYKKLTGDGNLTARLRYHQNNKVIDAEENVADGMTYQNIGAILLSSETAVNYALVGEDGTQIGTTEPGKTSVLTFPGVGKYILATSNKVISFTIGSVVSGVETIAADAAKVYGANGNIVVEAEAAADVNVYNAAGMLVAAQKVGAGRTNIALAKGFYVVRAGNTVTKVAVR